MRKTNKTERLMPEAKKDGRIAFHLGKKPSDNPHCPGSLNHANWLEGYREAKEEFDEEQGCEADLTED